ncbi:site-specific integrase [Dyadobacter sp. BHUBP1]|uniref:site-specific integrase n=1 Tax=Dyadobacter sp. BHUBP1 TaxID=3424178 RepID=UPI003D352C0F
MLVKSFTLLFYLKRRANYQAGELPIYMRITVDGDRFEMAIKRQCEPERWNAAAGRKQGNKEDVRQLNAYLDSIQAKVYQAQESISNLGKQVTAARIKDRLLGIQERPNTICEIFREHNEQMRELVGKDFVKTTYNRYVTALKNLEEFLRYKYNASDIRLDELDYDFISNYAFYLKAKRNISHNVTMKYLVYFKKIVLICVKKGWLLRDPFIEFSLARRDADRFPLDEDELIVIEERDFRNERLTIVRDIFLFCCYTGLSYADVKNLSNAHISSGFDGRRWITIKRQKTDVPSRIPLLPVPEAILNKYLGHVKCQNDRLLPILSNQKMNAYLKEIGDVCGINKEITFHLARHTFATTVTLANDVAIESVSKMLGHKNIKTTQHYAKIVDKKISVDMISLTEKLNVKRRDRDLVAKPQDKNKD